MRRKGIEGGGMDEEKGIEGDVLTIINFLQ